MNNNGGQCALVKVQLAAGGAVRRQRDDNAEYKTSEYWC